MRQALAPCVFDEPVCPGIQTFACRAREGEGCDPRIENLDTALEVIHSEVDVGQEIDLVDDQHIDTAVSAWIFVGLVIPFGDGGHEYGFVCAKLEVGRAYQVANVFNNQQVKLGELEFFECSVHHHGIEVTIPTRIDLDGSQSACSSSPV